MKKGERKGAKKGSRTSPRSAHPAATALMHTTGPAVPVAPPLLPPSLPGTPTRPCKGKQGGLELEGGRDAQTMCRGRTRKGGWKGWTRRGE